MSRMKKPVSSGLCVCVCVRARVYVCVNARARVCNHAQEFGYNAEAVTFTQHLYMHACSSFLPAKKVQAP